MRLVPRDWHTETWVCSMRGHVTPAANVVRLRPEDHRLGIEVDDNLPPDRLVRCLRCDVWLEVADPSPDAAVSETLPPVEDLPKPRRGRQLQEAVLVRLIAIDKAVHSLVFGLLAVALGILEFKLPGLQHSARSLRHRLSVTAQQTGPGASRDRISIELHRIIGLHRSTIIVFFATAVVYCILEGVEAVGLWKERRWAEYLTVIATAGLLPIEVHELVKRVTVFRIGALVVNVAILVWLVLAKHLFGVRGGAKTLHEHVDWHEVLDRPAPARHL
jgi:uncharacterized membrane protein (DUF2068 family)